MSSAKIGTRENLMFGVGGLAAKIVERAPTKDGSAAIVDQMAGDKVEGGSSSIAPLVKDYNRLEKAIERWNSEHEDDQLDLKTLLDKALTKVRSSVVNVELRRDGTVAGRTLKQGILSEIQRAVVGFDEIAELTLIAQLCKGHILLEGPVGVAKTHFAKSFAMTAGLKAARQQFVGDMMPSDIRGQELPVDAYDDAGRLVRKMEPEFGPAADANIFLADEVNRAPEKAQGALLDMMAEGHMTVGKEKRLLGSVPSAEGEAPSTSERFFTVIATQNPSSHAGTYELTEANEDRFMFKVEVGQPTRDQLAKIADLQLNGFPEIRKVTTPEALAAARVECQKVLVQQPIIEFVSEILINTRPGETTIPELQNKLAGDGASPRALGAILNAARAKAYLRGGDFVTPEDVKAVARPILMHRVKLDPSFAAGREGQSLGVTGVIDLITDNIEDAMKDELATIGQAS